MPNPLKLSARANTIMRALRLNINSPVQQHSVGYVVEDLLSQGMSEEEVTNIVRPLVPAYKSTFKALDGLVE